MRTAATLVLVRDGRNGPEVLLVERGTAGDFPGVHVFPGGLVDAGDSHPGLLAHSRRDASSADGLLDTAGALPSFIAAVRESLEEVGVLLAADEADASLLREWQAALLQRKRNFHELLAEGLPRLATDHLGYFSHWVTPVGIPRRYDTRFFVARMPDDQEITIDGREAVRADWLTPADALSASRGGDIRLIFPTVRNLEALATFASVDELLAHAQAPRKVPVMLPRMKNTPNGIQLLLPGDAGYEDD